MAAADTVGVVVIHSVNGILYDLEGGFFSRAKTTFLCNRLS